jgi:hypothetical protein
MARVTWSAQAVADLDALVTKPAVRDQLTAYAENMLHDIPPITHPADEGVDGEIMWHRGAHDEYEDFSDQEDGPQNYFLFYRRQLPGPGFEVLGVRSLHQVASAWVQMNDQATGVTDASTAQST